MKRVCIWGGGAALAQPLIAHHLEAGDEVLAACLNTVPVAANERLTVTEVTAACEWPCDLLVTFAGSVADAKLASLTDESWEASIAANLTAIFQALRWGARNLAEDGNVVVVGSIVGTTGGYGCAGYAAAKAGLLGLVRAAANELASRRVCVNLLELGYVEAGMGARLPAAVRDKVVPTIPLRRFGKPEEVVEAISYMGRTRYMTGNVLTLAGGLR